MIRVSGYVRRFASRLSAVLLLIREKKREKERERRESHAEKYLNNICMLQVGQFKN